MVYLYTGRSPLPIKFKRMKDGWKFLPQIPQMNTVICQSANQRPLCTKHTKITEIRELYICNSLHFEQIKRLNIQPKGTGNVRTGRGIRRGEI